MVVRPPKQNYDGKGGTHFLFYENNVFHENNGAMAMMYRVREAHII